MRRYRISVAALMSAILVFALGFAALHTATIAWSQAISALVAITLAGAAAGALFTHGNTRAFCGGLALFGWQFLGAQSHPAYFGFPAGFQTPASSLAGDIATVFHPLHESPTPPTLDSAHFDDESWKNVWTSQIALGLLNLIYAVLGGVITLGLVRLSNRRSPRGGTEAPAGTPGARS